MTALAYGDIITVRNPASGSYTKGEYVDRYRGPDGSTVYVVRHRSGDRYHGQYCHRNATRLRHPFPAWVGAPVRTSWEIRR